MNTPTYPVANPNRITLASGLLVVKVSRKGPSTVIVKTTRDGQRYDVTVDGAICSFEVDAVERIFILGTKSGDYISVGSTKARVRVFASTKSVPVVETKPDYSMAELDELMAEA